jgi:hypothetical protein
MLPDAIMVGVPYELFWHLTPKKLKAFYKAYNSKMQVIDMKMWEMGVYVMKGIVACFSDKGYPDKPLFGENSEKENSNQEEVAVFEMKQRINELKKQGLPESPM